MLCLSGWSEGRAGGSPLHKAFFDRPWILGKKIPGRIFNKTTWHWTSFPRLTGVFWCLVHLNKSRDLSTSSTRQLWLCFCGRKQKKKEQQLVAAMFWCADPYYHSTSGVQPKQIQFPWTCLHIKVLFSAKLFTFVTMIKLLPFCWLLFPASLCSHISPRFGVACLSGVWQH